MSKELRYIDLFAGCGGLSLGLHNAGWKGVFAIEKSPFAFETLEHNLINKLNHFDWPKWLPQKAHDIDNILKLYPDKLRSLRKKIDMVAGGPPCQGFSSAGKREESDERNHLVKSYIKFIRIVQPKIIFFENVKGFTQPFLKNKTKGKRYSDYVTNCLKRSTDDYQGYEVISQLVDFSMFGVPQKRTRFILIGVRKDIYSNQQIASIPFFTRISNNKEKFLISKGLSLNANLEDAISDLLMNDAKDSFIDSNGYLNGKYSKPKSAYQKYLREGKTKEGQLVDSHRFANHEYGTITLFKSLLESNLHGLKITGKSRTKFNIKKRSIAILAPRLPARTLTSHPDDYVHYSEPRILTVREYARIQSFPDWYEMKGKYTTGGDLRKKEVPRYTQLGNAIPPLFGEQSGLVLKDFLINGN